MDFIPTIYKFIIIFKDELEQKNSLEFMNNLGIPEEFSEKIFQDTINGKCDMRDIAEILEESIYNETWFNFYNKDAENIYTEKTESLINKEFKNQLDYELYKLPHCAYYSIIEYANDDFCYEILKDLANSLKFIYKIVEIE